jgi:predicted  nucleic acid-binding Zn-ribbon protein
MPGSTEAKIATITENVRTLEGSVRDVEKSQQALSDRFHDFELESVESRGKIEASLKKIENSHERTEEMVVGLSVTVTEVFP